MRFVFGEAPPFDLMNLVSLQQQKLRTISPLLVLAQPLVDAKRERVIFPDRSSKGAPKLSRFSGALSPAVPTDAPVATLQSERLGTLDECSHAQSQ